MPQKRNPIEHSTNTPNHLTNLSQNSLVGWRSKLIHSTAVKVAGKGSYGQLCVLGVKLCPKNTKRPFWPPFPSKNSRQTWPKTHSWDEDQNWSIPRLLKLPGREVTANYVIWGSNYAQKALNGRSDLHRHPKTANKPGPKLTRGMKIKIDPFHGC